MLQPLLLLFHVLISIGLVTLVLLQQGKGAEVSAGFGSGASQTVFGSHGSGSFLFKLTGLFALLFFITSLSLGYFIAHSVEQGTIKKTAEPSQNNWQQLPMSTPIKESKESKKTQKL